MLIDRIFNKTKSFLNTDVIGNFSPVKFNEFLHDAIQERNEEYFDVIRNYVNRQNRGLNSGGLENLPNKYSEKILHYSSDATISYVASAYTLPEDYRYLDLVTNQEGVEIEVLKSAKEFNIYKSFANSRCPISRVSGKTLKVFPATTLDLDITYLRKVKYPKWTYTIVSGSELFNPDAVDFEDADIHPSEEDELVKRVLLRFGIHLKDADIQNYVLQDDATEFKKSNTD